jgi:hypothetical protein
MDVQKSFFIIGWSGFIRHIDGRDDQDEILITSCCPVLATSLVIS